MRFVCISDTHGSEDFKIPDGDVLIHAGDFCNRGDLQDINAGLKWMGALSHGIKILVPGNHDVFVESNMCLFERMCLDRGIVCLHNMSYIISNPSGPNITVYGTAVQPRFYNWAFNIEDPKIRRRHYDNITMGVDILVTHCPPNGILDAICFGESAGCPELAKVVNIVKPKYHIFGHIHPQNGMLKRDGIWFINA